MDWLMMDWLILLLLVPAIIVPVVLLWGFAGCGLDVSGELPGPPDPTATAPTNLEATAMGTNRIELKWQNNGGKFFDVERSVPGSSATRIFPNRTDNPFPETEDLKEGTTYAYTVRASFPAGFKSDASNEAKATTFFEAPSNVVATPAELGKVNLEWTNNSKNANQFIIQDELISGGVVTGTTETKVPQEKGTAYSLTVADVSQHQFRVIAYSIGFQNSVLKEVRSLPSDPVKPLAFKTDLSDAQTSFPPSDQDLHGYCLVQRITPRNSGANAKITLRGPNVGTLVLDKVTISEAAGPPSDPDPWNSAAVPHVVAVGQSLPPSQEKTFPTAYTVAPGKDLLISFDINADPVKGRVRRSALPGSVHYYKAATAAAGDQNRQGFDTGTPGHYLVVKIEVS